MKAELSQRTLGILRRILEGMEPGSATFEAMPDELVSGPDSLRFWKDALFDFGFAQTFIDVAASYEFKWGDIIPDLFLGRFGQRNSNFSNALPRYFCEQTLKRLLAFGLLYSRDLRLGDELRQSLADDGFDLKRDQDNDFAVPADVQQKLKSVLSEAELEIINIVVDRFLSLHESTPRKPLVIKFKSTDNLERLVRCGVLKTNDQGQHYLPQSLAFHYSGNTAALDRARNAVEITLNVLRNLYELEPDKPESHFKYEQIEEHAKKMYDSLEEGTLKLGLYLLQEFSGVLGSYGSSGTEGTQVMSASINERIVRLDINVAWDEHIQQYSQYIEREQFRKRIARSQQQSIGLDSMQEKPKSQDIREETVTRSNEPKILVLISHSSRDQQLASALIDLLRSGLGLLPKQIRCSSVDGYRLPAGVQTDAQLRAEVNASKVLIGLITPNSLASPYVLFELGARWGAGERMIPLLAGVTADQLRGPLSGINALSCSSEEQLHQTLQEIGSHLEIEVQSPAAYLKQLRDLAEQAENVVASPIPAPTVSRPKPKLVLSVGVTGTPPERQLLHVKANQSVKTTRLEYLLSSGAAVASDTVNIEGESFDIPIEDAQVLKVWNTPRPDRNWNDHSGPAKLRVTLLVDGVENAYTIPVQMDSYYHVNTHYRKLSGSESFRGE